MADEHQPPNINVEHNTVGRDLNVAGRDINIGRVDVQDRLILWDRQDDGSGHGTVELRVSGSPNAITVGVTSDTLRWVIIIPQSPMSFETPGRNVEGTVSTTIQSPPPVILVDFEIGIADDQVRVWWDYPE